MTHRIVSKPLWILACLTLAMPLVAVSPAGAETKTPAEGGTASTAAAVINTPATTPAPSPTDTAEAPGDWGTLADVSESVAPMAVSPIHNAGNCGYVQVTDNPHLSNTGWAASAHGWWEGRTGFCRNLKANIVVELQAVWCSGGSCSWRTVDTGTKTGYPGGGSANRAAARENCSSGLKTGYRVRVDVDVIGRSDPVGWTTSSGVDLMCRPSS